MSASPSPAFGPCGIPDELAPPAELGGLAGAGLAVLVVVLPADDPGLLVAELDEFEPQAATARAATTRPNGARRRIGLLRNAVNECSSVARGSDPSPKKTPQSGTTFRDVSGAPRRALGRNRRIVRLGGRR